VHGGLARNDITAERPEQASRPAANRELERQGRIPAVSALLTLVASVVVLAGAASASATIGMDDYPSNLKTAAKDSMVDPWGFYNRECTSFVAWRLNDDNGVAFSNNMKGPNGGAGHFGNAGNWLSNAQRIGYSTDMTPKVGSVAWWSASARPPNGHVAWVESVSSDGTSVTIEQYNANNTGMYSTQTIATSSVGKFIHIHDIPVASGELVATRIGSNLYVKDAPGDSWTLESTSASGGNWKIAGNRIGILDSSGLEVKDGIYGSWTTVASPASSVNEWQITGTRIAYRNGSILYAKNGLGDSWTLETTSASPGSWKIADDRIANKDSNGLSVKQGLTGSWTLEVAPASSVPEWQITGTRIAYRNGSNLYVKDGLNDSWTLETTYASAGAWKIAGNRIAALTSALYIKEGLTGTWQAVVSPASSVNEWDIAGTRIAYRNGSNLYAKDGLTDTWTTESTSVSARSWQIAGNRIAVFDGGGLEVKVGLVGSWVNVTGTDAAEWLIT
jgi:surface antigen